MDEVRLRAAVEALLESIGFQLRWVAGPENADTAALGCYELFRVSQCQ